MMLKTCWIGLAGCALLLAACGSGASPEEAKAKDAAGSTPAGDAGRSVDSGASVGADVAKGADTQRIDVAVSGAEAGSQSPDDAPVSQRLDATPASVDAALETLGREGPKPDSALPVDLVVDARVAELGPSAEAGTGDSAVDRADTSSKPPSFACRNDSDCCIKIDSCRNVAYMYSTAPGASPEPEIAPSTGMCTPCIPAAVQVRCVARQCLGEVIPSTYSGPLLSNHCGLVKLPDAGVPRSHLLPELDASAPIPKSVWTCGGG